MKILVMAAHGNQGRVLLPKLRAAGFEIRAVRATPGRERELKDLGASEVMSGNQADRGFLREAVAGVDTVYHIGPTASPLEREMGFAMIDTAREAGIGHFIYSSVLHTIATKMVQHKLKNEVEEHLLEANVPFTILHPADYMVPAVFAPVFESGVWEQPFALDKGQAMVDIGDLADAGTKVALERDKHFGATYELCAPGNHDGHAVAAAFKRVSGIDVTPSYVSPDAYFERYYGKGQTERFRYELGLIRSVGLWYSQYVFAGNPNVLSWLLGRPPVTLDEFIARQWEQQKQRQK
jgi:uncharacterized protein YbjT (DUF2867 family)